MTHEITAEYEGAILKLTFEDTPNASLFINGVNRETRTSASNEITLKLNSVVQTGYEYHESIEARIHYKSDNIEAILCASDAELARKSIPIVL